MANRDNRLRKVTLFSMQFLPKVGGLENVVRDWAYGLTYANYRVQVITTTHSKESDDIFPFDVIRNASQFRVWRLMREADVIIGFNISLKNIVPCLLAFRPTMISHQSTNYDRNGNLNRFGGLKQFIVNHFPEANIACSHYVAGFIKKNPIVIHNTYNSELFRLKPAIKREHDLVFLGRLVSDKGCDVLIRALGILKLRYLVTLDVTVIGEGPELNNLKILSVDENVESQVKFIGSKGGNELVDALNAHKMLIVPSIWEEPFGIVALEGLSCGCRVLVSDSGGLKEAIGNCGKAFKKGDPDALALAIRDELNQKSEIDHEQVVRHLHQFTIPSAVGRLINVLETL